MMVSSCMLTVVGRFLFIMTWEPWKCSTHSFSCLLELLLQEPALLPQLANHSYWSSHNIPSLSEGRVITVIAWRFLSVSPFTPWPASLASWLSQQHMEALVWLRSALWSGRTLNFTIICVSLINYHAWPSSSSLQDFWETATTNRFRYWYLMTLVAL